LDDYNMSTEERKSQFEALRDKDLDSTKTIDEQMRKLLKLQDTISQLKGKMTSNTQEFEDRNNGIVSHCIQLKSKDCVRKRTECKSISRK
jgi:dsDNA-specific endonuclease/ATPase MutS2